MKLMNVLYSFCVTCSTVCYAVSGMLLLSNSSHIIFINISIYFFQNSVFEGNLILRGWGIYPLHFRRFKVQASESLLNDFDKRLAKLNKSQLILSPDETSNKHKIVGWIQKGCEDVMGDKEKDSEEKVK